MPYFGIPDGLKTYDDLPTVIAWLREHVKDEGERIRIILAWADATDVLLLDKDIHALIEGEE